MNNFYLIGVVVIGIVVIVKLFCSHDKSDDINKKQIRPEMSKKNKWLYPTDGLGKMEKGVQDYESKETYGKGKKRYE